MSLNVDALRAEAQLPAEISYDKPVDPAWQQPVGIFLTGTTGFLGVYLLKALLEQTQAYIFCLVRADDKAAGMARIKQQMQFYCLWQDDYEQRILAVVGDLTQPKFGLADKSFTTLAAHTQAIYHNGAQVNAMYSYERLRDSNVGGTLEVLRLAAEHHTKPVNFISSLAVFFSDAYVGQQVPEAAQAHLDEGLKGGYKQSKWVAEALVQAARQRGLPAIIHRPGRVLGDSSTGIIDRYSDLLANLLQACLQMGAYPQLDTLINVAPVDYVAQAIVNIGQQADALNHNFHISNPRSTSWLELWQAVNKLGYAVEPQEFQIWKDNVTQWSKGKQDKQLFMILRHLLRSPIYLFAAKPEFATIQTQALLRGSGTQCPVLDEQLLCTYLSHFHAAGVIAAPQVAGR